MIAQLARCRLRCCPALSSEQGLISLKSQVVRGSVGSPNVMVGDRLELDACDLELVCTLYLVPSTFEVSALALETIAEGLRSGSRRNQSSLPTHAVANTLDLVARLAHP